MAAYTYIMGSPTGTLYIGVTSDIYTRIQQHKAAPSKAFPSNTTAPASSTTNSTGTFANP